MSDGRAAHRVTQQRPASSSRESSPVPPPRRPRRPQHPELPAELVLSRGCPVRIEQIALVEHRVGNRAHRIEGRSPALPGSRAGGPTTESHVVRPCLGLVAGQGS